MLTIMSSVSVPHTLLQRKCIDKGEIEFRHSPIVVGSFAELAAADGATVFLIVKTGISKTYSGFHFQRLPSFHW